MRYRKLLGINGMTLALLAGVLAACVPVTVNISFPQERLDAAARNIEETEGRPRGAPAPAPARAPSGGSPSVSATPRTDSQSPEAMQARQSRRERRPALRQWKERGCVGETNQGTVVARPGSGCGPEATDLIRAENADRKIIYHDFMRENKIPASDRPRVNLAFAKARQERARANDWIQLEDGQWIRKPA
jgi:uncharacterized protein YdbL (DUF1318 family)